MHQFLQQIFSGLAAGAIYASVALALVMIYRATDLVNFAQGEMAMFSTYIAWTLVNAGLPFWAALLITLVVSFIGGMVIERVLIRPVENAPVLAAVIVTSLLRRHLSRRTWRLVHLLSYLCWPVAWVHSFFASDDLQHGVLFFLALVCAIAIGVALVWRLVSAARDVPRAERVGLIMSAVHGRANTSAPTPGDPGAAPAFRNTSVRAVTSERSPAAPTTTTLFSASSIRFAPTRRTVRGSSRRCSRRETSICCARITITPSIPTARCSSAFPTPPARLIRTGK